MLFVSGLRRVWPFMLAGLLAAVAMVTLAWALPRAGMEDERRDALAELLAEQSDVREAIDLFEEQLPVLRDEHGSIVEETAAAEEDLRAARKKLHRHEREVKRLRVRLTALGG